MYAGWINALIALLGVISCSVAPVLLAAALVWGW
jgi:hypothetical protein